MMISEVVLVKGEPLAVQGGNIRALRGLFPFYPGAGSSLLIEADTDAFFPESFLAELPLHLHLTEVLAVEVRKFEVFEHHLDQLIQTNFGFVVIYASLVAGLMTLRAVLAFANRLAGL
jgi:hypothetical protein